MYKKLVVYTASLSLIVVLAASCTSLEKPPEKSAFNSHPTTEAYDGWQVGMMAYTFKNFTLFEAIGKTRSLGLNSIDVFIFKPSKAHVIKRNMAPKVGKVQPNPRFHYTMSDEEKEELKAKLEYAQLRIGNCYVANFPDDKVECRKVFEFANEMQIDTFVAEPKVEQLDMLEKLCKQYKVRLALHNHPTEPGYVYGDPDSVMELCKGRNKWIGTCADTGHWMRSGINPVEALRKYHPRLFCLHLKDLNEFGKRDAHDVPWGTGKLNLKAVLEELRRQNFKGEISFEYEYNWNNSMPELRESAANFNRLAAELNPTGWKTLITDDLSNFVCKKRSWIAEEGVLAWNDGGHIWTKEKYGDFILDLEFKLTQKSNSGIFIRNLDNRTWGYRGLEVQVYDTFRRDMSTELTTKASCGAIYDCVAPSKNMVYSPDFWNRCTIICKANEVFVVLNGEQIIDMDLNNWPEAHKNPDGTKNKFPIAFKTMHRTGFIGFQDHDSPIWYRNIRIKRLD